VSGLNENISSLKNIEIESIHDTSVKILEEIGIKIGSKKALDILTSVGCLADHKSKNVIIPKSIIEDTLSRIKPQKKIYNRDGSEFLEIGKGKIYFHSSSAAIKLIDLKKRKHRLPRFKDLEDLIVILDYCKNVDIVANLVDPLDVPSKNLRIYSAAALLKNTSKSCSPMVDNNLDVEIIHRMGCLIRGNENNLKEKPFYSMGAGSDTVLGFSKRACEIIMKSAELGIPTGGSAYYVIGLTAPLSISGSVALANASFLATLVLKTAIDPTNTSIYQVGAGVFDMKYANSIASSPFIWMYYRVGIGLGKYYKLPVAVTIASDAKEVNPQAIFEKAIGYLICADAGADIIGGAGGALDNYNMASFDLPIIEDEIIGTIKHYHNNFKLLSASKDFEMIKNSFNKNTHFLEDDYTLKNFRKEIFNYDVFIKDNMLNWEKKGMEKITDRASKKAESILKDHQRPELPKDIIKGIDEILAEATGNRKD